jgi:hypothetical protein
MGSLRSRHLRGGAMANGRSAINARCQFLPGVRLGVRADLELRSETRILSLRFSLAGVAELADALDSKMRRPRFQSQTFRFKKRSFHE